MDSFFRYSTSGMPRAASAEDRVREWAARLEMAGVISQSKATIQQGNPFHSDIAGLITKGFATTRTSGSPVQLQRTRALVKSAPCDDFMLLVSVASTPVVLSQFDRSLELGFGEAALLASDDESLSTAPMGGSVLSVAMPRASIKALRNTPEDLVLRKIGATNQSLRLLRSYADLVFSAEPDAALAETIAGHVNSLAQSVVASLSGETIPPADQAIRAAHLVRINHVIAAGFPDPAFDVDSVARAVGLSRRYVQLILSDAGGSVSGAISTARLERARQLLESAEHRKMSVTQIAFACGFSDLSTFNRGFQKKFSLRPTDIR
ncbi:MAG: AraC family transcriptional regulator [Beijerinckiaceae bacterium]